MKVAVCGLGSMGKNHKRIYEKLGCEVFIYDPKIPEKNDPDAFLKQDFSHISICSPTKTHVSTAARILEHKEDVKVLIEKPIGDSVLMAEQLLKYSDRVVVGHIERFNPTVQWLHHRKDDFYSLKFTRINNVQSREINDVGIDLMVHDADLANFILNSKNVGTVYRNKTSSQKDGVIDCATMYCVYDDHTHVHCESSWLSPHKKRTIEFTCASGYGEVDLIEQSGYLIDHTGRIQEAEIYCHEPLHAQLSTFLGSESHPCYGHFATVQDAIDALAMVI